MTHVQESQLSGILLVQSWLTLAMMERDEDKIRMYTRMRDNAIEQFKSGKNEINIGMILNNIWASKEE